MAAEKPCLRWVCGCPPGGPQPSGLTLLQTRGQDRRLLGGRWGGVRRCEKAAWGSRGGRCPGNLAALLVRCLPTTCRLVDVLRGSCSPSEQEWARTVVQRGLCGLGKASAHPLLEARGVQGRVEGPGGQGPLPALPALASPRCLGAWVPGAARIATFPRGRGRGCPGRLAVSTELASASWGWLGELVPSTRSCLQRPVPQAVCVLLREPQKLLERWAWPGAIFLLQSPWEGSRAPLRTARLSQHRRSLCPASEAMTAACMGSWAPVPGSQSWWG